MYTVLSPSMETQTLTDCRLAAQQWALPPLTPPPALHPHPDLQSLPLDGEHTVTFVPGRSRIAVLNKSAQSLLAQPIVTPATGPSINQLYALGLLVAADGAAAPQPTPITPLTAWLHLTDACNLRCTYCYIVKHAGIMPARVAQTAIDTIVHTALRHGYSSIALKYAGGEPTLALDRLETTHRYAQQQAAEHGLTLHAAVLSNGTRLTPPILTRLADLDLRLMISLDGPASLHDARRPHTDGRGSFAEVCAGVERAAAHGLNVTVAITVSASSVAGLPGLIDWLLERDLPFTVSFERTPTPLTPPEAQTLVAGLRRAYARIAARPPQWSVLGALLDRADLSHSHAHSCAAGRDYLVFDSAGRLHNCQMLLRRTPPHYLPLDPLKAVRSGALGVQNVSVDQRATCRTCAWRYWCGGGCPLSAAPAHGRFDAPTPFCPVYLELFPELVHLEGRRLLYHALRATTA